MKVTTAVERARSLQGKAQRKDWYRIENKIEAGTAEIYIYDEIGMWGVTANDLVNEVKDLSATAITLHLNSPGGEVFDGFAIYQALKSHSAEVTVVVDSLAASIASVIAMGADKLIMAPRATLMIHDAFTVSLGNAEELRQTADLLDKMSDNIAETYAEKAGQDAAFWRDRMRAETWYSAEEALEAGLADEIQGKEQAAEEEPAGLAASTFAHSGRDSAPAPVIKPLAEGPKWSLVKEQPETPAPEEAPFDWSSVDLLSALRGAIA